MNTPTPLAQARQAWSAHGPDAAQDAAVLAQLLAHQQSLARARRAPAHSPDSPDSPDSRAWRWLAWGAGGLGAATALLLCLLVLLDPPGGPLPQARVEPGFIPVVSEREWRHLMAGSRQAAVWLQTTELPRERLALLGLPFDPARAEQPLRAELMLHPDGQLLAVRFLP